MEMNVGVFAGYEEEFTLKSEPLFFHPKTGEKVVGKVLLECGVYPPTDFPTYKEWKKNQAIYGKLCDLTKDVDWLKRNALTTIPKAFNDLEIIGQ